MKIIDKVHSIKVESPEIKELKSKKFNVCITTTGLDELQELLVKAESLAKELDETLEKIKQVNIEVKTEV